MTTERTETQELQRRLHGAHESASNLRDTITRLLSELEAFKKEQGERPNSKTPCQCIDCFGSKAVHDKHCEYMKEISSDAVTDSIAAQEHAMNFMTGFRGEQPDTVTISRELAARTLEINNTNNLNERGMTLNLSEEMELRQALGKEQG